MYVFGSWIQERMGIPRVMGDSILLPNGIVIVLNGARKGLAGDSVSGGANKVCMCRKEGMGENKVFGWAECVNSR